jgi:hypothetical protein
MSLVLAYRVADFQQGILLKYRSATQHGLAGKSRRNSLHLKIECCGC